MGICLTGAQNTECSSALVRAATEHQKVPMSCRNSIGFPAHLPRFASTHKETWGAGGLARATLTSGPPSATSISGSPRAISTTGPPRAISTSGHPGPHSPQGCSLPDSPHGSLGSQLQLPQGHIHQDHHVTGPSSFLQELEGSLRDLRATGGFSPTHMQLAELTPTHTSPQVYNWS